MIRLIFRSSITFLHIFPLGISYSLYILNPLSHTYLPSNFFHSEINSLIDIRFLGLERDKQLVNFKSRLTWASSSACAPLHPPYLMKRHPSEMWIDLSTRFGFLRSPCCERG